MTLTNRLTLFSLAALGVVLAAFSGTMYGLARTHLFRQLNDRATAILDTLVAAAEVEEDGLEWQPQDRRILLRGDGVHSLWGVFDENGQRLDGSDDPSHTLDGFADAGPDMGQNRVYATWGSEQWRLVRRTVRHPNPEAVRSDDARKRYRTLVFVTAWPVAPVHETLRALAWSLGGVSSAIWVAAGLGGRWVGRRALAPVSRMTESAKRVTADDLSERLPVPVTRDELRDLAASFNALLARLQDAFERQRHFTAEASHQLRTPLTAIQGQVEVALRRDRDGPEYRRVLASVAGQTDRLRQLVEMLLFLARADHEAAMPDTQVIDLMQWLPNHVRDSWQNHDRFSDISVLNEGKQPINVRVQPILFGQAIDNLMDNAIKYSPGGSSIQLSLQVDQFHVVIQIQNRVDHNSVHETDRIGEPFFRGESSRHQGITGLGLGTAIARRIILAFRGTLIFTTCDGAFITQMNVPLVEMASEEN